MSKRLEFAGKMANVEGLKGDEWNAGMVRV